VIDYSKFGLERSLLWTGVGFGHDAVKLPCFMTRDVITCLGLTPVVAPKLRGWVDFSDIEVMSFRHRWFPEGRSDAL